LTCAAIGDLPEPCSASDSVSGTAKSKYYQLYISSTQCVQCTRNVMNDIKGKQFSTAGNRFVSEMFAAGDWT